MVEWELVTRRSIGKTEEIGAAATTEARNRVYGSVGDDYQGGSGCGSGNQREYLASVAVAGVEGWRRKGRGSRGTRGHAKATTAVAAATVGAVGTAIKGSFLPCVAAVPSGAVAGGRSGGGSSCRREERRLVAYAHKEGGVDSTRHKIHTVVCSYLGRGQGRRYSHR